jgi:amino acid transporter
MIPEQHASSDAHALTRGLGFWQATAINITQIVGAGVFATIPLILGFLPGAYALLAWLMAGVLIIFDSMIWGELGAALPSAGGSYHFLLECYGRSKWGKLMSFLFIWQILISGPLELASGLVAAGQFSRAIDPDFTQYDDNHRQQYEIKFSDNPEHKLAIEVGPSRLVGFALGLFISILLYRRITTLGRMSVFFLVGVLGVLGWVLIDGALHFDPALAFDISMSEGERPNHFGLALGAGMGLAIYSYFGYYNICYLGDEVKNPARTIPRSILVSTFAVIILFALTHLSITSVVPWRAAKEAGNVTAHFMNKIHGSWAATLVTLCLIGSCFASSFSGLLGYSRVPFAAARDDHFFRWFTAIHPRHRIPHYSLLLIGGLMLFWSFFSLEMIITALIATRILEQFIAQIFGVIILRNRQPGRPRPWRMYIYPLPCVVALAGWIFVYASTGLVFITIGLGTLLAGAIVFLFWAKRKSSWPFDPVEGNGNSRYNQQ